MMTIAGMRQEANKTVRAGRLQLWIGNANAAGRTPTCGRIEIEAGRTFLHVWNATGTNRVSVAIGVGDNFKVCVQVACWIGQLNGRPTIGRLN